MYDALVTLPQVKQWLGYTDSNSDGGLTWLIKASSELIGRYTSRKNLGAVISFNEFYFASGGTKQTLILNNYPVVSLTSITVNGVAQAILTYPTIGPGFFLHNDLRTLLYIGGFYPTATLSLARNTPINVQYTAGYATADIPPGLQQACIQHIGEITKSQAWIGYRSKSLAGETVAFDTGATMSMSPRTVAMINPYIDKLPAQSIG